MEKKRKEGIKGLERSWKTEKDLEKLFLI